MDKSPGWTVRTGPLPIYLPVMASLGIPLGKIPMSNSGVTTLSMFPNMEDRPRVNNIPKKSTDHTEAAGMCRAASVKTMKARPGPEALCNTEAMLWSCAQHTTHIITHTHSHPDTCASIPLPECAML